MHILGLDCGGTSAKALLTTTRGEILGTGRGGPANYMVNGVEGVVASAKQAIYQALQESALDLLALQASGVILAMGVSGASRPPDLITLTEAFEQEGFPLVIVTHDATIAQLGALSGADGAIVIAGTGSIAYGIKGEQVARVGGWGYLLGDEGSALWISLQALQQVMWGYDGRAVLDPSLEQAVLKYFQLDKIEQLIPTIYRAPIDRGFIGGFSKTITQLAIEGHLASQRILAQAGTQLARLGVATLQKLELLNVEGRVGACGGVFAAGSYVLDPMQTELEKFSTKQVVTLPDFEPVVGAVLLGAQRLNLNLPEIVANVQRSI